MSVPVDIFVKDESPLPVDLVGVEVGIYDVGTHVLVASATTDVNGQASFMLPGLPTPGLGYEVRFFKLGVNFHGLRLIQVTDPELVGAPNKFDHTGADSNILPVSGNPYTCRCTGVFVDFSGQPIVNKTVRIMAKGNDNEKVPKIWNVPSHMVSPDEMQVTTDGNGRVSFDLVRTGEFRVTFGGDDDTVWCIRVPDQVSANFIDLIHPYPALWDWDDGIAPGNAVTVVALANLEVPFVVTFTDYEQKSTGLEVFFDLINSDGTVVEATYDSNRGVVVLRGLAPGSATLTPTLKTGILPNRWPVPAVVAPALAITVT